MWMLIHSLPSDASGLPPFLPFFVLHIATKFMDQPSSVFLAGDLLSLVGNNTHVVQYKAV